jgi:hypothetical protein
MAIKKTNKRAASSKAKKEKTKLKDLQQTNGKTYEYSVDQVRKLEDLLDIKTSNPFGTTDSRVFSENLASMNLSDMQEIAVRAGVFPNGNKTVLKNKLVKAFKGAGFGMINSVIEQPDQFRLDPNNAEHKKIIDYLRS